MFETPLSSPHPPRPRLVLTALLTGSPLFLAVALSVGPLGPAAPASAALVWLGLGGALLAPALGSFVGARLRGDVAPPLDDAGARAQATAQALIVEGALCEAGAMLGGIALLLNGPDWRLLGALAFPLGRLLVLRDRAGDTAAPA